MICPVSPKTLLWISCLSVRWGSFKAKFMWPVILFCNKRKGKLPYKEWKDLMDSLNTGLEYHLPDSWGISSAKISLTCRHLLACLYLGTCRHPSQTVKSSHWSTQKTVHRIFVMGTLHFINVISSSQQPNENLFALSLLPLLQII